MLKNTRLFDYLPSVIIPGIFVTLRILFVSAFFSIFFGLILGTILVLTDEDGLTPNKWVHSILGRITDIIRSFPMIILIVAIAPVTRAVIGTTIGPNAAIFAITLGSTPFAIRMTENSFKTVDSQLIKAAKSFGASKIQIVTRVILVEALPNLLSNFTIMLINMLNTTAMAGAVGAGGLGAIALTYGYQMFDHGIMYFIVVILIIFVILIQALSNFLYKKLT